MIRIPVVASKRPARSPGRCPALGACQCPGDIHETPDRAGEGEPAVSLAFEALDLAADAGLRISAYTAEPGSPSEGALNLLASWAAALDQADTAQAAGEA